MRMYEDGDGGAESLFLGSMTRLLVQKSSHNCSLTQQIRAAGLCRAALD